ncbi:YihY/virulence factor BrkB family protein (plasmid) [Legionella lytica]|uniref:YihY/virulence factor BrkB family protein n=1 Tax=Legionella lytica TaxID=96232 RepID=A0ABY4YD79_9GAMM|nr:YihY/virulence factor BrkB family protein [Legionella lytica]USQ15368.1 YihY/virulence factor BrkB family protein [Legionella lytica]
MTLKFGWLHELYINWQNDRVSSLAAALAYYTLFSLAPILLICISLVGTLFGEDAARGQILGQVSSLLGEQTALQIQEMIKNVNHHSTAFFARIFSIIVLLFSASRVFSSIQEGLNIIWGVQIHPHQKWFAAIKNQFVSFAMILIFAFLLFSSLILSALLAILSSHINYFIGTNIFLELIISHSFSFLLVTLLFALMFKSLPYIELKWSNIWVGALITALLFSLGKIAIGFYLNKAEIASVFGAASSVIVLLIWVYYSAQIFFIGAEITKIYTNHRTS